MFFKKKNTSPENPAEPSEDLVENNLRGIELEASGDIDSAICLYEYNVEHRFEGNHPYDRLAIIYRRQKDYDKEVEVLQKAIDVFTNDVYIFRQDRIPKLGKFKTRLAKAEKLYRDQKRVSSEK